MGAYAGMEQNLVVKHGVAGSAVATITGAGIDTAGYSEAIVIASAGVIAAGGSLNIKVQHADADSGYADLTSAAFTAWADSADGTTKMGRLKLDGNVCKRWIKLVSTVAAFAADHGAVVVLSGNQYNPQTVLAAEFTV